MADCFVLCQLCDVPIGAQEDAHTYHDPSYCTRYLDGWCRCDGWVCMSCCPDEACTPLQEACLTAREDVLARAARWEAAQYGPSSIEGDPSQVFAGAWWFGGVG